MQCYADISIFDAKTDVQIDGGYSVFASKFGPPFPPDGFEVLYRHERRSSAIRDANGFGGGNGKRVE